MLRAVLFDMDGVIYNSEPLHFQVETDIFRALGLQISEREHRSYVGMSSRGMWTTIKLRHGLSEPMEKLVVMEQKLYMAFLSSFDFFPVDGVVPLLDNLKENGVKLAVASSAPREQIDQVLGKLDLTGYFAVSVSGESVLAAKPAPDLFLKTASLLDVPAEETAVVEDSKNGVSAARAAGMKCVGFRNPDSGNQDLSGADLTILRMEELNFNVLKELF